MTDMPTKELKDCAKQAGFEVIVPSYDKTKDFIGIRDPIEGRAIDLTQEIKHFAELLLSRAPAVPMCEDIAKLVSSVPRLKGSDGVDFYPSAMCNWVTDAAQAITELSAEVERLNAIKQEVPDALLNKHIKPAITALNAAWNRNAPEGEIADAILLLVTLAAVPPAPGKSEGVEPAKDCGWSLDEPDCGGWATQCGGMFMLTSDTPQDNDIRFCPYCGGTVTDTTPQQAKP